MLLSLILTGVLSAQAPAAVPSREAAVELAESGQQAAALDAFRRIAAANPGDHEARLWIARLHEEMNNPELAEPVYRSVLLENPGRLEARIGLGQTLVTLGRNDEAIEVLEPAEAGAPGNPEVLAALGRAHRQAGRTTRSLAYLERAVSLSPSSLNQASLDRTRRVHGHRIETTGFFEDYGSAVADTRSGDLRVNVRLTDAFRVSGRAQVQRKFGLSEERGGLGLEWRWRPATIVTAQALAGPGADVLPRADVALGAAHVEGHTEWSVGVRYFHFSVADVTALAPAVAWAATDRLSLGLRYALTFTDFDLAGVESQESHSATVHGSYEVYPRVFATLAYSRGIESFENLSPDRIGNFRGNTAAAGVRLELATLTSVLAGYEYQWRRGVDMHRVTVSLAQRF